LGRRRTYDANNNLRCSTQFQFADDVATFC
jgi:hypothetical protein